MTTNTVEHVSLTPTTKAQASTFPGAPTPPFQAAVTGTMTEQRDIEAITAELLACKQLYVEAAYEIGNLLLEAKSQLDHGEWLTWLRDRIDFSERTAHRFMQLAKGYSDSTTLASLGYSKALCLLAIPEVERSAFMKKAHKVNGVEKGVDKMSARELERTVREHNRGDGGEAAAVGPVVPEECITAEKRRSDAEFNHVQECLDEMLERIQEFVDTPASYSDLANALCALCERILQEFTPEVSEAS